MQPGAADSGLENFLNLNLKGVLLSSELELLIFHSMTELKEISGSLDPAKLATETWRECSAVDVSGSIWHFLMMNFVGVMVSSSMMLIRLTVVNNLRPFTNSPA